MNTPSVQGIEAYLTPTAFQGLHEKGLVVAPHAGHIARIGEIIGNELPSQNLPGNVEHLSLIIRGSTTIEDKRKFTERDVEWLKAGPAQRYYPTDELQMPTQELAHSIPKASLAQPGRYILEFTASNPGTWGTERPERFVRQWTARRALSSMVENVPHEIKGAFEDLPIIGSKKRVVNRILGAVSQEKLDPFVVTKRHGGAIRS